MAEDHLHGATGRRPRTPIATPESHHESLVEVAQVALKLGFTAFGGPAAHIAMLREETVVRRQWLTDAYFLDLVGATNLIPGPNSTEMVIHIGYLRAGWRGAGRTSSTERHRPGNHCFTASSRSSSPSSLRPCGVSGAPLSRARCFS